MARKNLTYYKEKLLTLRSAMTQLLEEMEADAENAPAPSRKRQNLKEARVLQFSHKGWTKQKPLKTAK